MLPIGTFAETSGTYVNFEGRWQSFAGAANPVGDTRPGWKVLRVLANLAGLPGFEYTSSDQVRDELRALVGGDPDVSFRSQRMLNGEKAPQGSLSDVPMYAIDALVRRAPALQRTRDAQMRSELT
jgi:NADH-quinone oxidoreductase subunit G